MYTAYKLQSTANKFAQ